MTCRNTEPPEMKILITLQSDSNEGNKRFKHVMMDFYDLRLFES